MQPSSDDCFVWVQLHWAEGHPGAAVFFLTWLYYIHFLNAIIVCVTSIMCITGLVVSPHRLPGTCFCPCLGKISTILILSRALRVAFWTAFLTIWAVVLVGQDTCKDIDAYEHTVQENQLCKCLQAEGGVVSEEHSDHFAFLEERCQAKTFSACLGSEIEDEPGGIVEALGLSNSSLCSWECLVLEDRSEVLGRDVCDRTRCERLDPRLNCYWGEYECPARVEDFDLVIDNRFNYCRYSLMGDLISTQLSPISPTRTDLDQEIHDTLHDVTLDVEHSVFIDSLVDADVLAEGTVCEFSAGSGGLHTLVSGTDPQTGEYVGPKDDNGMPVGNIYPRNGPDAAPGIRSAEACAEYVMETEPSANRATFSGIKTRGGDAITYPLCYAEFNDVRSEAVTANSESDDYIWSTCPLVPTDNFFLTVVGLSAGGQVTIPAQCRLEMQKTMKRRQEQVTVCNSIVDATLFVVCIILLLLTYSFSRLQYSYYLTIEPESVASLASGGGGGDEGAHVQLEDVGSTEGRSEPSSAAAGMAHDARP